MLPEPGDDPFQTKTTLCRMFEAAGLSPRRRLGQHFLIDRNLMQKLVDAAEIQPEDCVLEVGAGTGSLTAQLARRAARVVAVEIDPKLARLAESHLAGYRNVTLLSLDALKNKSTLSAELASAIRTALSGAGGGLKLVANLPYAVATPLVLDLLLSDLPVCRLCFTVQREVADRFLATPHGGDYGPVGIITQVLASCRRLCTVPPQAFWPRPEVHSAMVRLDAYPAAKLDVDEPGRFAGFVRPFFNHRRKTMTHIAKRHDDAERLLSAMERLGIDSKARPENLSIRQWVALYHHAC